MKDDGFYTYKGIVIFGAPGSGKTTIAKWLLEAFPKASYIEASQAVVHPAFSIKDSLPREEKKFIQVINKIKTKKSGSPIPREKARVFFTYLKNRYSPSVIAKTLTFIHEKRYAKKFVLIAGIRGYHNSTFFKKNGYLVVYLKTPEKDLSKRVAKREDFSLKAAEKERHIEERLFSTNKVEKIAHLSFNTALQTKKEIFTKIKALIEVRECAHCVNTSTNLSSTIGSTGLCETCERYEENFSKKPLIKELAFLKSLIRSGRGKYDVMVGISGGKDSTATLYQIKKMGFTPLSFTFDTGYYPHHIFSRSSQVAKELGVDHQRIDIRKYARTVDRKCFEKTAALYNESDSQELKEKFRKWYIEGRRHYSIKCAHSIPFVRTCQLCRRLVVRAYYGEAIRNEVSVVVLGINEWAGLSQDSKSKKFVFSAIRKLQPFKNKPPVYIVHLPFLLQRRINDTRKILEELGWKVPKGEFLIESNANSCLFARAAENKARRLLGFHPDATRLAREVTVGFITKEQAKKALTKVHNYPLSVHAILRKAKILQS
ncbi:MAG: 7-cyano-7-deazaguanine synthase [Candidatus Paceibacterota bacterium]|jgi:predicted PP-loop superfamily ATPase/cytidylate kinase